MDNKQNPFIDRVTPLSGLAPTPAPTPEPASTPMSTPDSAPTAPIATPVPAAVPTPTPEPTPAPAAVPTPAPTPAPAKKKRTGLIISLIVIFLIILGSGGTFATFAVIKNSAENILLDSLGHLVSADQVAASGTLNFTPKNLGLIGIDSILLDFDVKRAQSNQSADANLQINFTDGTSTDLINFGEVMLQNGVFYLHVDGINPLYQNSYRTSVSSYIQANLAMRYTWASREVCYSIDVYDAYLECINSIDTNSPELTATIAEQSDQLLSQIDEIVAKIDGQWFEFSIQDILNSDFLSEELALNTATKQGIASAYNCSIDIINHFSNYSDDFSNLYHQYPFVNLTPRQNDSYAVSLDANRLAGYLNNMPSLRFYQDVAKCTNVASPSSPYQISAADLEPSLQSLPDISLRFDGFLDHHLTNAKVSQSNNYYDFSLDINFTYPSNLQVSAPADSLPIMDLVQEVYTIFLNTFQLQ